ncbi:hypothetical protein CMUST_15725 (plasmid) [Corynebacterium mustelae]|uniref:Uncharacterized protein n=1 Tax=Corynebacterium mustelae TaxID=571915 RepID=A0A0G3GVQ4_9CORY|nr:hypothetical protein [Corynebacterium mustelae]AKK05241.1 hypothetical protein CMUST_04495 [Corynebacterium mustelae]AKK07433.1 hypothetical protein CMUST_15725 [Corynebacterium mustelae]
MKASQVVAVEVLSRGLGGVRVSTRKPDPAPNMFVVVSRIGGGEATIATRDPRFLVECFARSEDDAEDLAEQARAVWRSCRSREIHWAYVDNNLTRFDDPDPKLFRFQFTAGLSLM